jgi:SAM-dependent methyltransferase
MNQTHLELCGSDWWAEAVEQHIIPWVLGDVELGDDVVELGPGPGRTTDVLRGMVPHLTAIEVDAELAQALADRMAGSNVEVVHGDATALDFPDGRFTAALSLTMLHHVPSVELQDRLFAEAARVLRAGGVFAGLDGLDSEEFRALHVGDTCVPLEPSGLDGRLRAAGFADVRIETNELGIRFRAALSPER